jgi:hypothetical protein
LRSSPAPRISAGFVFLSVMARAGMLLAQTAATDKALAEALFQDARKLMDAGNTPEACLKFAESQRLDPSLGTLLNLAVCHEKEGRTASAWAEFKEAASVAASAGKQERADFAKKRAAELEARLSRIVLDVPQATAGMALTLNGKELSTAAATGSGMPVDPGEVTIAATAPGKKPWSERVTVEAGPSTKQLAVPALEDVPPPQEEEKKPPPPPAPKPLPKPPEQGARPLRTLGFVTTGVGVAGLGAGAVFGLMTLSQASEVEEGCKGGCDQAAVDKNDDAKTTAMVSNIAFGAGVACVGAGVTMILLSASPKKASTGKQVWVSPEIGSSGGRVTVGGWW